MKLNQEIIKEDWESWKDDCIAISSYIEND